MRSRLSSLILAFSIVASFPSYSVAQEGPKAPVLTPLSEQSTLPNGQFDTLGIRLGMPLQEALARLKELGKGRVTETKGQLAVNDNRGNKISFYHVQEAQALDEQPEASDHVMVSFTTTVNEPRVMWISRDIRFREKQGSIPDFLNALKAKFGEPSIVIGQSRYEWIWAGGKLLKLTTDQAYDYLSPNSPGKCVQQQNGGLTFTVNGVPVQGCTTALKVRVHPGARNDLMNSASITLYDFARFNQNLKDTNAWIKTEMDRVTNEKSGVKPRL